MQNFLICVPWGEHAIQSEMRLCSCGAEVAVSKENLKKFGEMEMQPLCLKCGIHLIETDRAACVGGLIGGKVVGNLASAVALINAMTSGKN